MTVAVRPDISKKLIITPQCSTVKLEFFWRFFCIDYNIGDNWKHFAGAIADLIVTTKNEVVDLTTKSQSNEA